MPRLKLGLKGPFTGRRKPHLRKAKITSYPLLIGQSFGGGDEKTNLKLKKKKKKKKPNLRNFTLQAACGLKIL